MFFSKILPHFVTVCPLSSELKTTAVFFVPGWVEWSPTSAPSSSKAF